MQCLLVNLRTTTTKKTILPETHTQICMALTLLVTHTHSIQQGDVFVRDLSHHAGCLKEGLEKQQRQWERSFNNTGQEGRMKKTDIRRGASSLPEIYPCVQSQALSTPPSPPVMRSNSPNHPHPHWSSSAHRHRCWSWCLHPSVLPEHQTIKITLSVRLRDKCKNAYQGRQMMHSFDVNQ